MQARLWVKFDEDDVDQRCRGFTTLGRGLGVAILLRSKLMISASSIFLEWLGEWCSEVETEVRRRGLRKSRERRERRKLIASPRAKIVQAQKNSDKD